MTQEGNGTFALMEQAGARNRSTSDQPGISVNANLTLGNGVQQSGNDNLSTVNQTGKGGSITVTHGH
ncbi:MAG: hypothetical protein NVSMB69_01500 [Novosphingobium sp.]